MSQWNFFVGKRIMQILLMCITLLLMFIGIGILNFLNVDPTYFPFDINIFVSQFSNLVFNFYAIIICFIILTGMFGIFAILTGKSRAMELYGTFLFIAFILNAVIGVMILRNAFFGSSNSSKKFFELMENYDFNREAKTTIDSIQDKGNCCGYFNSADWYLGLRLSENLDFDDAERFFIPNSCCSKFKEDKCISYNSNGCYATVELSLTSLILLVVLALSVLSILLLLAVLTASYLRRRFLEAEETLIFPETLRGISMQPELKIADRDLVKESKKPFDELSKA